MQEDVGAGATPRNVRDDITEEAVTDTHQEAVAFMSTEQGFTTQALQGTLEE